MDELTQLLGHVNLFRGLSQSQLERVAALTEVEEYQAHDVIFNQDTEGRKMYVIGQGQVEVRVRNIQGVYHASLILGEGQVFGEMALLDQGERSASVTAMTDNTRLYTLDEPAFTALCKEDTALGYIMMRNLALELSIKIRHQNFDY